MKKHLCLVVLTVFASFLLGGCNAAPEEKILGAWERHEEASGFWGPKYYYLIVEKEQFTKNGLVFDCVYGEKDKHITVGPPAKDHVAYTIKVINENTIKFNGTAGLGGSGEYTRTAPENIEAKEGALGLWKYKDPTPPWEWRRAKR